MSKIRMFATRTSVILLLVGTLPLIEPAIAMDVKIGQVSSTVNNGDAGTIEGATLGKLVQIVAGAIKDAYDNKHRPH